MSAPPPSTSSCSSSSSSSSSSFSYRFTYDVFLSFRGPDTRHGFIGHLYKALNDRGIRTFIDDEELRKGEEITPSLVNAIQESRIAIPVFSMSYASSPFCLDELVKIMECVKGKGRLVLPVFYDVHPRDVRHQRGSYGEAMAKHEERFKDDKEKVQKWREALHQAANLSGNDFKHGNEYEYVLIEKIVKWVSNIASRIPLHVGDYPVGHESRVLKVISLLNDRSDDEVYMVGIHGIGGIGKTTLARAVYNLIADQFEGLCFLDDVRENSAKHGLVHLQERLLSEVVRENDIKLGSVNKGVPIIKHRLHQKKVLLVLDDVDKLEQLRAIVGGPDWFGSGSRVMITTRDKHLLVSHGIQRKYDVEGLNEKEAIELLTWIAFKDGKVDPNYMDVINQAVTYASGLPLALEVIGSNLLGKNVEEWRSALDQYKRIPIKDIQKILKVSFDVLEEYQQKIFLDIACFFKGYILAEVEDILHAHHGVNMKYGIGVLVEKSLIKIDEDGYVSLHDLIQDMGIEIVRQESPERPGKRSRLWLSEDIVQVLKDNTGTSKVEIMNLDFRKFEDVVVEWNGEAFKKMENLKTLIVRGCRLSEGAKHLPNSLRALEWWGYPSQSLPADFHPKKLVLFKLPNSCLTSLDFLKMQKEFVNMRVLIFDRTKCVTEIPDVSCVPNLEELSFAHCENLIKIDESVGLLDKLKVLNAQGCSKLRSFPPIKLTSLEKLHLSYCSSLESFPEILGKMEILTELYLRRTSIKELPYSIRNLTRLRRLHLHYCGIIQFPSSIFVLPELDIVDFRECEGLLSPNQDEGEEQVSLMLSLSIRHLNFFKCNISDGFLPIVLARFPNLEVLSLSDNNFTILPACINECRFLRNLYLHQCKNLQEIRGIPPNIENLFAKDCISLSCSSRRMLLNKELHEEGGNKTFILPGGRIPNWFEHQRRESSISFWFRYKFPAISLCVFSENKLFDQRWFFPKLIINNNKVFQFEEDKLIGAHYTLFIFDKKQIKFKDNVDEVLLENEWNHAVFSLDFVIPGQRKPMEIVPVQLGLHIFKESRMNDIRFTDPLLHKEENGLVDM